ncbi:MAG: molybdopterin-binding protein [Gammaproteobacteria bacterium]|nr:molybdopterin-binding protein [Gammaproteobacteria bacterium]
MKRRTVMRLLGLGSLTALSGCDRLSQATWFPRVLGTAESVNRHLHRALGRDALAKEFTEADLSPMFPSNGTRRPMDADYQAHAARGFAAWRLSVGGLVERPRAFSLAELRALPSRTQITRHDCVEGWSAIAKWHGVRLAALLDEVRPLPQARFVVFHCFDTMDASGARYYESIDFEDARHAQTILAYDWNDRPLPMPYGAPLRLRVERQLGYKMAKYLRAVELVESFEHIDGGRGGYWEDRGYEWYAGI